MALAPSWCEKPLPAVMLGANSMKLPGFFPLPTALGGESLPSSRRRYQCDRVPSSDGCVSGLPPAPHPSVDPAETRNELANCCTSLSSRLACQGSDRRVPSDAPPGTCYAAFLRRNAVGPLAWTILGSIEYSGRWSWPATVETTALHGCEDAQRGVDKGRERQSVRRPESLLMSPRCPKREAAL